MTENREQRIYIYEDPESRVRFLETQLHGHDWRASIVIPTAQAADGEQHARELEESLKARGYATSIHKQPDGTVSLDIHHFGHESHLLDSFRELGIAKGSVHTLKNIGPDLTNLVGGASHFMQRLVKEPARLFSGIYVLGDISYSFAGWFENRHAPKTSKTVGERWKDFIQPSSSLMSLSGYLALAQSLTFVAYANTGGELDYSELKEQFRNGTKAGVDATNVAGWTAPGMHRPLLGAYEEIAKKNPIEAGSWAQISGQVALMGASYFQVKKYLPNAKKYFSEHQHEKLGTKLLGALQTKTADGHSEHAAQQVVGAPINILRAMISISGWLMLMHPAKKGAVVDSSWSHPLHRLYQELQVHPERMAGITNSVASLTGLGASLIKKNTATIGAEAVWLAGDFVMMFVKKDRYGDAASKRELPLIAAASRFMREMPVALAPAAREKMIDDLSEYLAKRTIGSKTDYELAKEDGKLPQEVAELKQKIAGGLRANMAVEVMPYDRLTAAAAKLAARFPVAQREAVVDSLTKGLAATPGIFATQQELAENITARLDMKAEVNNHTPGMAELSHEMAQLLVASPPASNAGVAMTVYDTLKPFIAATAQDMSLLNNAVQQETARMLKVSPQVAAQMVQQATSANAAAHTIH